MKQFLPIVFLFFFGLIDWNPLPAKEAVIISCSGKSGSTTLEESFKKIGVETYRVHTMDQSIRSLIAKKTVDTNIIFIDSTRDIISRKVSSFFENLTKHLNLPADIILLKYQKEGIGFVLKRFDELILSLEEYDTFREWMKYYGYDCLKDATFNFEKKYQFFQAGNRYFLNLRFDDIAEWESIIRSAPLPSNCAAFTIVSANESKHKWYHAIYKEFLKKFKMPQKTFDRILSMHSEKITHFYTEKEIQAFIEKWQPHIKAVPSWASSTLFGQPVLPGKFSVSPGGISPK